MVKRLWEAPGVGGALAWFPDGNHLACTTRACDQAGDQPEECLTLRDAATGAVEVRFKAACPPVLALTCSPTGDRVAAAGNEAGEVEIWHAGGEQLLIYRDHPYRVHALAWSPDGTLIASAGSELRLWDSATGKTVAYWLYWCSALAWSPDGQQLALACTDHSVRVLDLRSRGGLVTYRGHQTALRDQGADGVEAGWDGGEIEQLCWSPDGQHLASVGPGGVHLWHAQTGTCLQVRRGHPLQRWRLSWLPTLPQGPGDEQASTQVREAELFTDECLEPGVIFNAAWSPDGSYFAATLQDGRLLMWRV